MDQAKKNKRSFILLVGLILVLSITLLYRMNTGSTEIDPGIYKQTDLKQVDKVVMESKNGKVELAFIDNVWKVNNDFAADRNLVEVLFATIQQAEPKRTVAKSIRDSVANSLENSGVKVTLYNTSRAAETFFAGGNDDKTEAYFILPGSSEPHLMVIPGYRVYVSGIFELPAVKWKEKLVFDFNWRNFKKLTAEFLNQKGNFEVAVEKNVASIIGMTEVDTAKLNTFLDQISLLTVDDYVVAADQKKITDSLKAARPLAMIRIEDIAQRTYELKVFALERDFYALVHGDDLAILDRRKIVPLLRPKEFFLKQ